MWAIKNFTPYKAGKSWGRDKSGVHDWIVAVKATYVIKPDGRVELAAEQFDTLLLPEYNGERAISSIRYDTDLVGAKPTTDVIVNGTAYAPKGRPSVEFPISLKFGSVYKVINVLGNNTLCEGAFGTTRAS